MKILFKSVIPRQNIKDPMMAEQIRIIYVPQVSCKVLCESQSYFYYGKKN